MTKDEIVALSNAAADTAGIPRLLLLACLIAESGLNPDARRPSVAANDQGFWPDVSFGLGQQTVRWAAEYAGGNAYPGEAEIERVGAFYRIPAYATAVAAKQLKSHYDASEDDAIFKALARYNWPAGGGEAASPAVEANYRQGITDAAAILGGDVPNTGPAPVYDPTTPVTPQNHDWDCAEQSTLWAMTAYGRHPSDAWMEASMLTSGIESTDLGLLVGDGSQLAAWITEQYGEFGYAAHNASSVSFDDVKSVAGLTPVVMGGHTWNHWSGVRRYSEPHDWLELANPADGWQGISQTMTRQQFANLGPFSMVVVTWGGTVAPPVQPDTPSFSVGQGLADKMAAIGDVPASDERFLDLWSEAYGASGLRYRYYKNTGEIGVYPA